MFYEKLHIVIALFAALAATITSAINGDGVYAFSLKLVICVAVFYVLGRIIKALMDKMLTKRETDAAELSENKQAAADDDE